MNVIYEVKKRIVIDQITYNDVDYWEVYDVDPSMSSVDYSILEYDEVCDKPSNVLTAVKKYFREKMLKGEL